MEEKVIIETDSAPAPVGPYSQAVKYGNTLFLAGQIGLDPGTGQMVGPDTASQITAIFKSVKGILEFAGLNMGNIARCVVYLIDLNDMQLVNQTFQEHFAYQPPARSTVQVAALPAGARVEIEVTAVFHPSSGLS